MEFQSRLGAVRSGKSFVDIAHIIPQRLRAVKDEKGINLILGVSKSTIERNILQPMREIYTDAVVGNINSGNVAMVCGVPCYCLGAEKVSQVAKIQGSSVKYCYGDETAKWNKDVFYMLQSRLDKSYSKFDGACNPEYPGHWLKQFLDREDVDKYIQNYTIFDNPFIDKNVVRNLCYEYHGTVFYDRYIKGLWALAEGLIYPFWEKCVESPPDYPAEDYCLSIDYGTMNAFAAILWGKYGQSWYAVKEYYYSGREEITGTKTDAQYVQDMLKFVAPILPHIKVTSSIFGGGETPNIETIVDPSAASFIAALREHDCFTVIPARNDVLDGIRNTARAMQAGKVKISPKCEAFIHELQGYVWQDRADMDAPVKIADHACITGDSLIMTEHGNVPIRKLVRKTGKVWSLNTETGTPELKAYRDVRCTKKKAKIFKITLKDGKIIRCTEDHPVLTERGYVLAKYLHETDKIIEISP